MRVRTCIHRVVVAMALVLATACTSPAPDEAETDRVATTTATPPPSATTSPGKVASPTPGTRGRQIRAVAALPGRCRSVRAASDLPVTFSTGGRLYAADASGSSVACLLDEVPTGLLAWGGEADRVLLAAVEPAADVHRYVPSAFETFIGAERGASRASPLLSPRWSRPKGESVVYIEDGQLLKQPARGGNVRDISFLKKHDEVVYHPAGTHVAVIGEDRDAFYGIFLASNIGGDPQPLVEVTDARRVFDLAFTHDGRSLYYVADHGTRFDVHRVGVPGGEPIDSEDALETLDSADAVIANVFLSDFRRDLLAYQVGRCNDRVATRVYRGGDVFDLGTDFSRRSTQPAGWLKDGRLLVLVRERGCSGPADLYLWDRGSKPLLFVRGVDQAAVREKLPPPPEPPEPAEAVVA